MERNTTGKPAKEIVVQGIVSPSGWDKRGNVQALCIATAPAGYYYIEMENKPDEFMVYLKKFVEARGTVRTSCGHNHISISAIQITGNPDLDDRP